MITDSAVRIAASGTAWKTATMRGYIFKTSLDPDTYGAGAYKLTFREAANNNGSPVDYDFYYNVDPESSGAASAVDSTNLKLYKELLNHILTNIWQSGKVEDFELVRDGTGRVW